LPPASIIIRKFAALCNTPRERVLDGAST